MVTTDVKQGSKNGDRRCKECGLSLQHSVKLMPGLLEILSLTLSSKLPSLFLRVRKKALKDGASHQDYSGSGGNKLRWNLYRG